ncbi:hypothetical protein [Paracoccus sanguinis]|uniref:hypothetical protein n=1 Tax=Paracoccus sanguinis TaxID=1545044 RepID=UPI0012E04F5C|nr:hypothetical protein [Paracoccus sanguinis]
MRDRSAYLESACGALIRGHLEETEDYLARFRTSLAHCPLSADERVACLSLFERLRGLALAAGNGIDAARSWLADLSASTGGLDVYDRSGRQRVSTGLADTPRRY